MISLLGRYDILLLQEHWLNNNQLATFNCYFPGFCVHGVSSLDSSKILLGRPNGGVFIIYPDTFGAKAKFISNIILHLYCVYMPGDINNIYYWFIVHFPIWLDFPFITLPFQGC